MKIDITGTDTIPVHNKLNQNITLDEFNLTAINSNVIFKNARFEKKTHMEVSNLGSIVMWKTYVNDGGSFQANFGDVSLNLLTKKNVVVINVILHNKPLNKPCATPYSSANKRPV